MHRVWRRSGAGWTRVVIKQEPRALRAKLQRQVALEGFSLDSETSAGTLADNVAASCLEEEACAKTPAESGERNKRAEKERKRERGGKDGGFTSAWYLRRHFLADCQ